ncbi:MAG: Gfo/Idh/MocA family protein [Pirellula sp.]
MSFERRRFLKHTMASLAASHIATGAAKVAKAVASERVRVGVMGAGGRALSLIQTFASNPEVDIVAIADVDESKLGPGVTAAAKLQGREPRVEKDFRRLIDNKTIDALVIGTPDHWHAIPTILACQAGKDVYVEKPDSHNIVEGMRMVAAMRRHNRIVQMGSQHRSTIRLQSAMEFVQSGKLGKVHVAKAWESTKQGAIGFPKDSEPPSGVDYDMWIGPATKRPFNVNRFHGKWRWLYDFGTGDLGNDGVHRLDMAVALLQSACTAQGEKPVGLPTTVFANGGKWHFDDAQEFPDTMQVNYQFGTGMNSKLLTYEMRIWAPYSYLGEPEGSAVFGDRGYLVIGNNRWLAYGRGGEVLGQAEGDSHEKPHVQNFIDCIKSRAKPFCDLETVGHPASVLCHAGNISARVGRMLTLDPASESFVGDAEANELRVRKEYRKPWLLPE